MSIFASCKLESSFDEMYDENCNIREHWTNAFESLEKAGVETLEAKQAEIDWRLEDNGVTYNIYNTPDGTNRRWNLDPIPFIISNDEWNTISKGLKQRAKLLNLIFKDLYTKQNLLKKGLIPSEVIYAHKNFITQVYNFENKDYYNLRFYAADISRGPDGKFWVINDRTSSPSGLGYAIENRLTMNSISKELYPNISIVRIASFLKGFKKMLNEMAPHEKENPLIALLTPGPHNETYFEHSYLSSFLNLTLVQGDDLLVKNSKLWLKSLNGLKRVDALIRRVDSLYCDPLELRNDSYLGVAGLINVLRENHLSMVNPIGVGILENLGLNPFMKNIAKELLGEELILPQIATWWCGQEKELEFVTSNIKELMIKRVDKHETIFGKHLDDIQLNKLLTNIKANPQLYVGQEIIDFSTIPSFSNGKVEPRNAVIRAFAYKDEKDFKIMPGGLVRVSASKDSLVVSNQRGGTSKDLWILGQSEDVDVNSIFKTRNLDVRLESIPTKRAENLFWLGRYLNRTIITARSIRLVMKAYLNINRYDYAVDNENNSQNILNASLTHMTMTYPGFINEKEVKVIPELISILRDKNRIGSLSFTISMLSNVNVNVKSILAMEAWKIYEKLQREWSYYQNRKVLTLREHINELDKLIIYSMAYKELIDESIFKEQGLILYDIGRKIESSLLLISKIRSLTILKLDKMVEYDILESLLNSYESYNSYRAYYQSTLELNNVLEFLLFNTKYPKSLIYMISELLNDLKELPKAQDNTTHLSAYEEPLFKIFSKLRLLSSKKLLDTTENDFVYTKLDEFLAEISNLVLETSDELTKTYFSHYSDE